MRTLLWAGVFGAEAFPHSLHSLSQWMEAANSDNDDILARHGQIKSDGKSTGPVVPPPELMSPMPEDDHWLGLAGIRHSDTKSEEEKKGHHHHKHHHRHHKRRHRHRHNKKHAAEIARIHAQIHHLEQKIAKRKAQEKTNPLAKGNTTNVSTSTQSPPLPAHDGAPHDPPPAQHVGVVGPPVEAAKQGYSDEIDMADQKWKGADKVHDIVKLRPTPTANFALEAQENEAAKKFFSQAKDLISSGQALVDSRRGEVHELNEEISEEAAELKEEKAAKEAQEKEIAHLTEVQQNEEKEIKDLEPNLKTVRKSARRLERLEKKMNELMSMNDGLTNENAELRKEVTALRAAHTKLEAEVRQESHKEEQKEDAEDDA